MRRHTTASWREVLWKSLAHAHWSQVRQPINRVSFMSIRNRSIEDLLSEIRVEGWPKPIGALAARLTIEMAGSLENVWAGLHDVKKALMQSSAKVEKTLGESSAKLEKILADASKGSSKQTAALVTWTKVLVFATIAYTLLTGGLSIATILK